jgi:error-prone DNA polymerase
VEGEVVHVIARRLVDLSAWLGALAAPSRDFH